MVTDQLEPVDHVSLRSSSKVLWERRDYLPRLNADESVSYHLRYERGSCRRPENILSLVCTYCQRLCPRMDCFDDLMRRTKLRSRHCVICGIYHANVGWTYKDGVRMFGCTGCCTLFPEGTNVHFIASRVTRDGVTRNRVTVDRDSMLCDPCWTRLFQGRVRQPVSLFWLDTNTSKLTRCPR